ncbi:uncharacterized protein LOC119724197 [Patiria miniata]|uniref:Uncharacterized protein n=1 Tax=Patiria miniata TaxID=46514 RepID=A0A913ZJ43_PATMI|nr:uncharacterized protein LOC119724197 [Patiria miniata]
MVGMECRWRQVILLCILVVFLIVTYLAVRHAKKHVYSIPPHTSKSDLEFVVSHYNENLDWLKPLATHSHVYHKGTDTTPPFPVNIWEKFPNVGREGHTFLYHIIHNYDSLADLTVFLQGHGPSGFDERWCFPNPMEFVSNAAEGRYCKVVGALSDWGQVPHEEKYKTALDTGKMRIGRVRTTGEFYTAVFGTPPPTSVPLCFRACFSATKENLRRHPRSFYERAISFLDDHSDPEEGHMMERLWATIINTK